MDESNKSLNKMLGIRDTELTMLYKNFRQMYISIPLLSITHTLFFLL